MFDVVSRDFDFQPLPEHYSLRYTLHSVELGIRLNVSSLQYVFSPPFTLQTYCTVLHNRSACTTSGLPSFTWQPKTYVRTVQVPPVVYLILLYCRFQKNKYEFSIFIPSRRLLYVCYRIQQTTNIANIDTRYWFCSSDNKQCIQ